MQLFIEDELPLSLCYERSWSAIENHLMAFDRNHHRSKAEGSWPVTSVWASFAAVRKYLLEASDRRCRCGSLETIHGILWSVVLNGCWFKSASSPKKKKKKKRDWLALKSKATAHPREDQRDPHWKAADGRRSLKDLDPYSIFFFFLDVHQNIRFSEFQL